LMLRRGWPSSVLRPELETLPLLMACLLMIFRQPTPVVLSLFWLFKNYVIFDGYFSELLAKA